MMSASDFEQIDINAIPFKIATIDTASGLVKSYFVLVWVMVHCHWQKS